MLHAFLAEDPTTTNEEREPNFLFGFYPIFLPTWLVPWQAIVESMFFEVIIMDLCFIHSVTGIGTALLAIHFIKFFDNPFGVLTVSVPPAPIFRRARSRMLTIRNPTPASAVDETEADDDNNHIANENYNNQLRQRRHRRLEGHHPDDQNLTEENSTDTEDERDTEEWTID